ncbi:MAG TPA: hypothetical protein VD886_11825, partial [Herpetosiphonaceae bacterium]|nr:hypothetical protein [Herpetosiphonaceae bacterium]
MDDWDGTAGAAPGPPFAGCERIAVVVPAAADGLSAADAESLGSMPATLRASRAGLERELGAPIDVVDRDPGGGPRWLIGPA